MAATAAIISNPTPIIPLPRPLSCSSKPLRFTSISHQHRTRLSLAALASSLSVPPINVGYLETEFSGHGVSFEGIGDSCVVKMGMENGSVASLMLPSGLITSYKPYMWHGATFEVLHTTVSEGEGGEAVVQGGVSMDFKIAGDSLTPWPLSGWSLSSVRGSPRDSIEVELVSVSPENMAQVKCLITLQEDCIGSELIISNPRSSALELSGSFVSHLKVSTPDATYAVGLQGSNYRSKQPLTSEFCIIPPNLNRRSSAAPKSVLQHLLSRWGSNKGEEDGDREPNYEGFITSAEESEGEEDDDQASMTEKMSRVYTSAPRQFTIIDRGRRNSVVIGRSGFDEVYVFSPGSEHEWYGKYAYVCIGPSAKLKPLVLAPGGIWRGAQYLHNPNL